MFKYIITFVLVILMVKTNAQSNAYTALQPYESNDIMLVRVASSSVQSDLNDLVTKIALDPDFSTTSLGIGGYFLLYREAGSTISKSAAISNYMAESYVASASFVFSDGGTTMGVANDIFVKASSGVTALQVSTAATPMGMTSMYDFRAGEDVYLLEFNKQTDILQIAEDLYQTSLFDYTEPNYFLQGLLLTLEGKKTNSDNDCGTVRTPNTLDGYTADFTQWNMYTGTTAEFSSTFMQPYNSLGRVMPYSDINVCHAWSLTNGSANNENVAGNGINIAIVDDGVDTRHYELNMRMNGSNVYGYDAVNHPLTTPAPSPYKGNPIYNTTTDPGCSDVSHDPALPPCGKNYHGTLVAGVAAAKRNNLHPTMSTYYGMTGVANRALIMPVKIFWKDNPCDEAITTVQATVDGLRWATDNDADVLNCSWGTGSYNPSLNPVFEGSHLIDDEISYSTKNGRNGKGCVLVFGSGNNNYGKLDWPASHSDVISVGACNMCNERKSTNSLNWTGYPVFLSSLSCDDDPLWGSNYGYGLPFFDNINKLPLNTSGRLTVVAPGVRLISATHQPNNAFFDLNLGIGGTSVAAPHVSGVAAMMLSVNPCLTYQEVRDIIAISADKINPNYAAIYSYSGGWNEQMGYGRVNAGDAVTLAYDLYKQGKHETGTKIYKSSHHIYAGVNVTDIGPAVFPANTYYTVASGADINFFAPTDNAIHLEPGFRADFGSLFNAEIIADVCDNSHGHYRQGQNDYSILNNKSHKFKDAIDLMPSVNIYPNPVNDILNVSINMVNDDKVNFIVSDIVGRRIGKETSASLEKGKHIEAISTQQLTPGIYFITVNTSAGSNKYKFVKQ